VESETPGDALQAGETEARGKDLLKALQGDLAAFRGDGDAPAAASHPCIGPWVCSQPAPSAREKTGLCRPLPAPCARLAALPGSSAARAAFTPCRGDVQHGWDFPPGRKGLFTSQGLNHAGCTQPCRRPGPAKRCRPGVPRREGSGQPAARCEGGGGSRGSRLAPGTRRWVKLQDVARSRATKKGSWVTRHNPGKKIQNTLPGLPSALKLAAEEMTLRDVMEVC